MAAFVEISKGHWLNLDRVLEAHPAAQASLAVHLKGDYETEIRIYEGQAAQVLQAALTEDQVYSYKTWERDNLPPPHGSYYVGEFSGYQGLQGAVQSGFAKGDKLKEIKAALDEFKQRFGPGADQPADDPGDAPDQKPDRAGLEGREPGRGD